MDNYDSLVTEGTVEELARLAGLEVIPARLSDLAASLNALLEDADKVNRFMASRREVGPAVRFAHPDVQEEA